MIDTILSEFPKYFPEINNVLASGIPVFARVAGLMRTTPFLQRSEIPMIGKVGFALIFTIMLSMTLKAEVPPQGFSIVYSIIVNFLCGAILGFIVNCIIKAVESGGDMINMQQGVSSAMIMDPTTSTQISIMGRIFSILGLIIFMEIGLIGNIRRPLDIGKSCDGLIQITHAHIGLALGMLLFIEAEVQVVLQAGAIAQRADSSVGKHKPGRLMGSLGQFLQFAVVTLVVTS